MSPKDVIVQHKVVCAWCQLVLKEGIEPVSHGICPKCLETA